MHTVYIHKIIIIMIIYCVLAENRSVKNMKHMFKVLITENAIVICEAVVSSILRL